ncbi:MAG TPA: hypothetical protein VFV52_02685 [Bacilli bacterium]|nr:hypothetical protein [Bacilli bacterium]
MSVHKYIGFGNFGKEVVEATGFEGSNGELIRVFIIIVVGKGGYGLAAGLVMNPFVLLLVIAGVAIATVALVAIIVLAVISARRAKTHQDRHHHNHDSYDGYDDDDGYDDFDFDGGDD